MGKPKNEAAKVDSDKDTTAPVRDGVTNSSDTPTVDSGENTISDTQSLEPVKEEAFEAWQNGEEKVFVAPPDGCNALEGVKVMAEQVLERALTDDEAAKINAITNPENVAVVFEEITGHKLDVQNMGRRLTFDDYQMSLAGFALSILNGAICKHGIQDYAVMIPQAVDAAKALFDEVKKR